MFWTPRRFPGVRGFRMDFEFLIGSGDTDRGHSAHTIDGNQAGTKDNAFNGFGYYNTGLVLAPDLSNLMSLRISPRWRPNASKQRGSKIGFGADFFAFVKVDEAARDKALILADPEARDPLGGVHRMRVSPEVVQHPFFKVRTDFGRLLLGQLSCLAAGHGGASGLNSAKCVPQDPQRLADALTLN